MPTTDIVKHDETIANVTFSDQWSATLPFKDNLEMVDQFRRHIGNWLCSTQQLAIDNYTVLSASESLPFCEIVVFIESKGSESAFIIDHPVQDDSDSDFDEDEYEDIFSVKMLALIESIANQLQKQMLHSSPTFYKSHTTLGQGCLQRILSLLDKHAHSEKYINRLNSMSDKAILAHAKTETFGTFSANLNFTCANNTIGELMNYFSTLEEELPKTNLKAKTELNLNIATYMHLRQLYEIKSFVSPINCFSAIQLIIKTCMTPLTHLQFSPQLKLFFSAIDKVAHFSDLHYDQFEKKLSSFLPSKPIASPSYEMKSIPSKC